MESNTALPLEETQQPVERRIYSYSPRLVVSDCPEPQEEGLETAAKSETRHVPPEHNEDGRATDDDIELTDGMSCSASETLRRIDAWDAERVVIDAAPTKPNEVLMTIIAATRNLMAVYIKMQRRMFRKAHARYKYEKPPFAKEAF
jgi:hypothetical protein